MIELYIRAQDFLQELIKTYINPILPFHKFDLFKYNYLSEQEKKAKNAMMTKNYITDKLPYQDNK